MMDSPFVRRVAIALKHYELPFQLQALSVYQQTERLAAINPMLTVPVLRNASLSLLDSKDILAWLDAQVSQPSLRDSSPFAHNQERTASDVLALKAGELYREYALREPKLHCASSQMRIVVQMTAALHTLEASARRMPAQLNHSCIAVATSYRFARDVAAHCSQALPITPALQERCAQWENLPAFLACNPN